KGRKIKKLKRVRERGLKHIALASIIVGAPNQTGLLPSSVHVPSYALKSSVVSGISAASLLICFSPCLSSPVIPNGPLTLVFPLVYHLQSYQMANRVQIPTNNSALIAMIADEDTVVGFLLAGVGNVDIRRKTNYLIVDSKTTVKQIEDAFKEFTTREDVAIVLISQYVANMIRFLVDSYNKPVPAILEIPSKDHPYDPAHDSVLSRVKYLFNTESVASGRR
ncbi:V-type proton ATPase subunit F, partial [Glycine soja]